MQLKYQKAKKGKEGEGNMENIEVKNRTVLSHLSLVR